jgi:hypothetical protein
VIFSRQARRNLHENLPLDAAAMETIDGPLTTSPHRAGGPLDEPFDGYHTGCWNTTSLTSIESWFTQSCSGRGEASSRTARSE